MVCNGTAALAQIGSATVLMPLLGTCQYAIVVLLCAVSGFMVLYGRSWRYVAPLRIKQKRRGDRDVKERDMLR